MSGTFLAPLSSPVPYSGQVVRHRAPGGPHTSPPSSSRTCLSHILTKALTNTHPTPGLRHSNLSLDPRDLQNALLRRQHLQSLHGRRALHHDRLGELQHPLHLLRLARQAGLDDAHRRTHPGRLRANGRPVGDGAHHARGCAEPSHRLAAPRQVERALAG